MPEFIPQKNTLAQSPLPYNKYIIDEAVTEFENIKNHLSMAVLNQDLFPGACYWVDRLSRYLMLYGEYFSKEDHVNLVKLLYELITIPKLSSSLIEKFCSCLNRLLKKKSLLQPSDLQLDWKPLYEIFKTELMKKYRSFSLYRVFQTVVKSTVALCRIYFPLTATQEMLDEWVCLISPTSSTLEAFYYLDAFLPTLTYPNNHHLTHELWFKECVEKWIFISWPQHMKFQMSLLARLAEDCLGYISWENEIPMIYTLILRDFDLPVNYKNLVSNRLEKMMNTSKAKWIVNSLGGGSSGMDYLKKLFKSLESYFHPSNTGKWRLCLFTFVDQLTYSFMHRLKRERYPRPEDWSPPVPDSHKLTDDEIEEFVKILAPCVVMGKGVKQMCMALNRLATLRPQLVIPDLLDRFYSSHDNLTDPSLLRDALFQLYHICGMLTNKIHFPEGMTHVFPLLNLSLNGIDANDINKSMRTCSFLMGITCLIPLVNCSAAAERFPELTEYELNACVASESCEEFVLSFLDQCLHLIEACSIENHATIDHNKETMNAEEVFFLETLPNLLLFILNRCSKHTFKEALDKVEYFIFSRILEIKFAGKLLGRLLASFVKVEPEMSLSQLLPRLNLTITTLLTEENMEEERLDEELLFHLLLLSELISCSGSYIVPHVPLLTGIIDLATALKSREGYGFVCSLLYNMLYSLVSCQVECCPRFPEDYLPVKEWGQMFTYNSVKLNWYEPSPTEFEVAQQIFEKYLEIHLRRVELGIKVDTSDAKNDKSSMNKDELLKSLCFICSILTGSVQVIDPSIGDPISLISSSVPMSDPVIITSSNQRFLKFRNDNPRLIVAGVMSKAVSSLISSESDDIKTFLEIVKIYDTLLNYDSASKEKLNEHFKAYVEEKHILGYELCRPKKYCLVLHQLKAIRRHFVRLQLASFSGEFNTLYKSICDDLIVLSTSHYSEVRIASQKVLGCCLRHSPFFVIYLADVVSAALARSHQLSHEQFKGYLYLTLVMHIEMPIPIISIFSKVWPHIVKASHSEKLSIRALMSKLQDVLTNTANHPHIDTEVPPTCMQAAQSVWPNGKAEHGSHFKSMFTIEEFIRFIQELADIWRNEPLNWNQTEMLAKMLNKLCCARLLENTMLPESVLEVILEMLIHDNVSIRKISVLSLEKIMKAKMQKVKKFDLNIDYPWGPAGDMKQNLDPLEFLYDPDMTLLTDEEWNKPVYFNKQWGYCAWPRKFLVYNFGQDSLRFSKNDCVHRFFTNDLSVKRLFEFLSMENRKGCNEINYNTFMMFKGLFRNYGDLFLDNITKELDQLLKDNGPNMVNSQRCLVEVLIGLLQGSKLWPHDKYKKVWGYLLPCFPQILERVTPQSEKFWLLFANLAFCKQDPKRVHPFINFLCRAPLDKEESSFITCCRLKMIKGLMSQLGWKCVKLYQKLVQYIIPYLDHPFENVRKEIGSLLGALFCLDGNILKLSEVAVPNIEPVLKHIVSKLEIVTRDDHLEYSNSLLNLTQTVCLWIFFSSINSARDMSNFASVIPFILSIESCDSYREIHSDCRKAIHAFTRAFVIPSVSPSLLHMFEDLMKCNRWRSKVSCLEFLGCLIFKNLFITYADPVCRSRINQLVVDNLRDDQVEVRENSAKVLCSLIHCNFIMDPTTLTRTFKQMCVSKRKRSSEETLNLHAGILGLCAFVNASPYDVPPYLPDILMLLGEHLHDPMPIPNAIKSTLSNFKRTHLDNWQEHKKKFSSDQLALLNDSLVSPDYYA